MTDKIALPVHLADKLADLPEHGMGFQVVSVRLKNGEWLHDRRVVNSSYLLLEQGEHISIDEIDDVELSKS